MTSLQLIFLLTAAILLGAALMTVTSRRLMHSALWLIVALFGVAIIFALLQAGFFTVIQVVVYIGAIAILIIFAVMLTRRVMDDSGPQHIRMWPAAAAAAVGVLAGLVLILSSWSGFTSPIAEAANANQMIAQLGQALVSPDAYVLPFEVASILLLAAMVGAIYIGVDRR